MRMRLAVATVALLTGAVVPASASASHPPDIATEAHTAILFVDFVKSW
jgi:hypothetical protein